MGRLVQLNKARGHSKVASLTALAAIGAVIPNFAVRKPPKVYHPMITASDDEIRLWNDTVATRQVLRARIKPWRSIQGRLMWENRS
jgi:hypothetical protein